MTIPLLTTKLFVPQLRSNQLSRARLIEQVIGSPSRRLILVSAPAGYGKTTLVADLIARQGWPVAFISLDPGDNDIKQFTEYLHKALQSAGQQNGIQRLQNLEGIQTQPIPLFLTTLVNTFYRLNRELLIVLDDYHAISATEIHEAVLFLLEAMPRNVQVIISTRSDPPLRLAQFRARGELWEIRASDLRFDRSEAGIFFNERIDLALSQADIDVLLAKTEGWIAGLQLAGISLQRHGDKHGFITAFAGDDRYVMDYLLDEVLSHQKADVRKFLLFTSPLSRFCASLCDAIMDWPEGKSKSIVDFLDQANLFVIPLDNRREWYRYHHLFASLLQHRLDATANEKINQLHVNASTWFEKKGQVNDALQQAILGDDLERVSELVQRFVFTVAMRGDRLAFIRWVRELPESRLYQNPWICIAVAWALTEIGEMEEVRHYLEIAESDQPQNPRLYCHITAVRANLASLLEDHKTMARFTKEALACIEPQDEQLRGMLILYQAKAAFWAGDMPAAEQALMDAYRTSLTSGDTIRAVITLADVAEVQMVRGQIINAINTANQALALAERVRRETGQMVVSAAHAHTVLAGILLVTGEVEQADQHNQAAFQLSQAWGHPRFLSNTCLIKASLLCQWGDLDGALDAVKKAKDILTIQGKLVVQPESFTTHLAEVHLSRGELEKAAQLLEGVGIRPDGEVTFTYRNEFRILAAVLIAMGQTATAIRILDHLLEICQQGEAVLHVLLVQILKAKALFMTNDMPGALVALESALNTAAEEGLFVQVFIDEGDELAKLVYNAAQRGSQPSFCQKLLDRFATKPQPPRSVETTLVETLSPRELDVLIHIALGESNQEIAQSLHLSLYTVKSHARNIYSKLGVKNRTEAVAKARLLGLLPQD